MGYCAYTNTWRFKHLSFISLLRFVVNDRFATQLYRVAFFMRGAVYPSKLAIRHQVIHFSLTGGHMKSELIFEHVFHWVMRVVLILFCGGFLSSFIIVLGGGLFAVEILHAPTGSVRVELAAVLYGLLTLLIFHALTKFWLIREGLNEWEHLGQMHRDAVSKLKH